MGTKYLITGGSGFIGTNLVERLRQNQGNEITVLDVVEPSFDGVKYIQDSIELIPYDIFKDIDIVIHLACRSGVETSTNDPIGTFQENVYGTLRCLEGSKKHKVKRFIFSSSGGTVLGEQNEPLYEKLAPNPSSIYGASKLACEGYCKAYYKTYGLETVILRFSNVYGPHSLRKNKNLIPAFIIAALQGNTAYINGDGSVTKDYIYVKDLIKAIMVSTTLSSIAGETFQIATGKEYNINAIVGRLNILSRKYLGKDIIIENRNGRIGDVSYTCNISKAEAKLLFEPSYSLNSGLDETFKWFIEEWGKMK
jgi:UDP-glucose 4-epimerase